MRLGWLTFFLPLFGWLREFAEIVRARWLGISRGVPRGNGIEVSFLFNGLPYRCWFRPLRRGPVPFASYWTGDGVDLTPSIHQYAGPYRDFSTAPQLTPAILGHSRIEVRLDEADPRFLASTDQFSTPA